MSVLEAILLGLIQGLTEFLPVSSSGHLTLAQQALGWEPQGSVAFDVVVHLGTLLAVVVAYRHSLWSLLSSRRRAVIGLGCATLPLVLALFAMPLVEGVKASPVLLGLAFCATGVLLLLADGPLRLRRAPPEISSIEDISIRTALLIGVFQLLAVLPGVSRSGSTISCALNRGVEARPAAEFSFLLAIPAILGACILEAREIGALADAAPLPLLAGFLTSLVSGLGALWLLNQLLRVRALWVFGLYLIPLGVLVATIS